MHIYRSQNERLLTEQLLPLPLPLPSPPPLLLLLLLAMVVPGRDELLVLVESAESLTSENNQKSINQFGSPTQLTE